MTGISVRPAGKPPTFDVYINLAADEATAIASHNASFTTMLSKRRVEYLGTFTTFIRERNVWRNDNAHSGGAWP